MQSWLLENLKVHLISHSPKCLSEGTVEGGGERSQPKDKSSTVCEAHINTLQQLLLQFFTGTQTHKSHSMKQTLSQSMLTAKHSGSWGVWYTVLFYGQGAINWQSVVRTQTQQSISADRTRFVRCVADQTRHQLQGQRCQKQINRFQFIYPFFDRFRSTFSPLPLPTSHVSSTWLITKTEYLKNCIFLLSRSNSRPWHHPFRANDTRKP